MKTGSRRKGIALAACVAAACLAAPLAATEAWRWGAPGVVALFVAALATGATAVEACLQFDPARQRALRRRSPGERLARLVLAVPMAASGLGLVTGATVAAWEQGTATWRPPAPASTTAGFSPAALFAGGLALLVLACAVVTARVGFRTAGPIDASAVRDDGPRGDLERSHPARGFPASSHPARSGSRDVVVLVLACLVAPMLVPATLSWCRIVAVLASERGWERAGAAGGPVARGLAAEPVETSPGEPSQTVPAEFAVLRGELVGRLPAPSLRTALLRQLESIGYEALDGTDEGWIVARPATLFESWDLRSDGPHRTLPVIALRVEAATAATAATTAEAATAATAATAELAAQAGASASSVISWDLGAVGPDRAERTLWPGWLAAMVLLPAISEPDGPR